MTVPRPARATRPDDSAPPPLRALPIRVVTAQSTGRTSVVLEYDGKTRLPTGEYRNIPYRRDVGDPGRPDCVSDPFALAVLELINFYRELESTIVPLYKENDELRSRINELERAVDSLERKVKEQARHLERSSEPAGSRAKRKGEE